jgi:hypothetical protein
MHCDPGVHNKVRLSTDVLMREGCGSSSVFNFRTGQIYGLDAIATRLLGVLIRSASIQFALNCLTSEYDVDSEVLLSDLLGLVRRLLADDVVGVAA